MAKAPGSKQDVFSLDLDLTAFVQALKSGQDAYAKVRADFSKPIPIALDDKSLSSLNDAVKNGAKTVADAVKQSRDSIKATLQFITDLQVTQLEQIAASSASTAETSKKSYTELYSFLSKLAVANTEVTVKAEEQKAAAAEKSAARIQAANAKAQTGGGNSAVRDDYAAAQRDAQFTRFAGRNSRTGSAGSLQSSLLDLFGRDVSGPDSFQFNSGGKATNLIDPRVNAEIETAAQSILANIRQQSTSTAEQKRYADNIRKYLQEQADLQATAVREEQKFVAAMAKLPDRGAGLNSPVSGNGQFFANRAAPQATVAGPFDFVGGSQGVDKDRITQANLALQQHRDLLKKATDEAGGLAKQHGNIGASAAQTVAQLAKLYILYRAVRDVVREIEAGINAFVKSGFDYQDQLEQGQISLKAILGSNFSIVTAQGQQLRGSAALNALNDVAHQQWLGIAETADTVKAKTIDLVDIYGSVANQVSRLKGSTGDIQNITKGTAALAQQLGISFKEAGVQMAAVLEGKGGNRVSQALDLSKSDLFNLRDSPELITKVIDRLSTFIQASGGGQTIGDIASQFSRLMGVVSANIEAPFFDLLRDAVKELDRVSKDPEAQAFFALLRRAIQDSSDDLRKFGSDLKQETAEGLGPFIAGVSGGVRVVIQLAEGLVFVTKSLAEFGGQNQSFLLWIGSAALGISGLVSALNFGNKLIALSQGTGLVATALSTILSPIKGIVSGGVEAGAAIAGIETASAGAAPVIAGVTTAITSLGAAVAVGGLLLGLGKLVQYLARIHDEATGAKEALSRLQAGDVQGAILSKQQELNSPDITTKANAYRFIIGDALKSNEQSLGTTDYDAAAASVRTLKGEVVGLEQQLSGLKDTESAEANTLRATISSKQETIDSTQRLIQGSADLRLQAPGVLKTLKDLATQIAQTQNTADALSKAGPGNSAPGLGTAIDRQLTSTKADLAKKKAAYAGLLVDWQNFIKQTQAAAIAAQNTNFTPSLTPAKKDPDLKIPGFFSSAKQDLEELEIGFKQEETLLKSKLKNELVSQEDYETAVEALEAKRIEAVKAASQRELADRLAFDKKQHVDPATDPDTQRIQVTADRAVADAQTRSQEAENDAQGRLTRLNRTVVEQENRVAVEIAKMFGGTEDSVKAAITKLADDVEQSIVKAGGTGAKAAAAGVAQQLRDIIPNASAFKELQKQAQLLGKEFDDLRQEQTRLDAAFNEGKLTSDQYTNRTLQNRAAMILALSNERSKIDQALQLATPGTDAAQRLTEQFRAVNLQLEDMQRNVVSIKEVMSSFTSLISSIGSVLSVTDGAGQRIDTILKSFSKLSSISTLLQQLNKFKADFALLQGQGGLGPNDVGPRQPGVGGAASFLSLFSPNGAGTNPQGGATGLSAALGGITFGATSALSIGMALFTSAVNKAKKNIQDSIDGIAKSIQNGTVTLGAGTDQLEKQRQALVNEYSSSKSGRSALNDLLPQIDQQIDALVQKAKDLQKGFTDSLQSLSAGQGPFGDFARQLFDLQKQTKDYLDSFTDQTSQAYADAVANVKELFNLTLQNAKEGYIQDLQSDAGTAVSSAQKVNDLTDQQATLQKQLLDQDDQRLSLEEQRSQLQKDEATRLQNILDLQKQIADLLVSAAQQEADIRRQGVQEAQISVAEQKANQIADLRNQTADQLKALQDQLAAAKDTQALSDRANALDKQARDLQDARQKTEQQLALNEIELTGAQRVAEIEGAMFGLTQDRYQLAAAAASLEVSQAGIQVKKWQETKDLVDAIIKTGGEYSFTPPPGFPKVEVHIGSITIDNSDHSENSVTVPPGSSGGGSAPPSAPPIDSGSGGAGGGNRNGRNMELLRSGYPDSY